MNIDKIIDITASSVTNIGSALIGLKTSDPYMIAGVAAIGPVLENKLADFAKRMLSSLQSKRITISTQLICSTINQNIDNGKSVRNDDFFTPHQEPIMDINESAASKLFEGTLLKAKEEYDSKKIPFLSFLTANIFFAPNISESKAFVLLEVLSRMSYRQLCALMIFYRRNTLPIGRWESRLKCTPSLLDYYDIAYEFLSLKDSFLIEQNMPNGGMGMGITEYRISALGKELVITANLMSIKQQDLSELESKVNFMTSSLR